MSLTKNDLTAISHLINLSVDGLEKRLFERIDKLDDTLSIQTENGLQEIRNNVGKVEGRVDKQELVVHKIRQTLRAV